MTDVQKEMSEIKEVIQSSEPEAKAEKKQTITDSNKPVSNSTTNKSETTPEDCKAKAPASTKRVKYDGRSKKRAWHFNRRDDNVKRVRSDAEERVKRRKFLVVLGYAGANYFGMQRNPDVNTIEEELLKALFKNNMITDEAFQQPQYIHFQRAARTDKGVSAARQCISLKLPEQVDLASINADLPADIKLFGIKRVTKSFNCKDQCNARTYSYTLPSISFAPFKESVDMKSYRVNEATLAVVNETLKLFEGTKNFHNFTSRKKFDDPSNRRYIISFECKTPFMVDDVEFCTIIVKGQSFMMHQIRKMIGLTLAVVRGHANVDTIAKSFEKMRLDIPMAPGLGLVLDQVHYDGYNARFKDDGMHEQLEWSAFENEIQAFRDQFIYPVIKDTELKEQPMAMWLDTLTLHSYDERVDGAARFMDDKQKEVEDCEQTGLETAGEIIDEDSTTGDGEDLKGF